MSDVYLRTSPISDYIVICDATSKTCAPYCLLSLLVRVSTLVCLDMPCHVLYNCYLANGTRSWTHMHALYSSNQKVSGDKDGVTTKPTTARGCKRACESKQRTEAKTRLEEDHVRQAKPRGVNHGDPSHFHYCAAVDRKPFTETKVELLSLPYVGVQNLKIDKISSKTESSYSSKTVFSQFFCLSIRFLKISIILIS
jgi:hypothetical protein